jgi:hypothetical protein
MKKIKRRKEKQSQIFSKEMEKEIKKDKEKV